MGLQRLVANHPLGQGTALQNLVLGLIEFQIVVIERVCASILDLDDLGNSAFNQQRRLRRIQRSPGETIERRAKEQGERTDQNEPPMAEYDEPILPEGSDCVLHHREFAEIDDLFLQWRGAPEEIWRWFVHYYLFDGKRTTDSDADDGREKAVEAPGDQL